MDGQSTALTQSDALANRLAEMAERIGELERALAQGWRRSGDEMTGMLQLPTGPDVTSAGGGALNLGKYGTEAAMTVDSNEIQTFNASGAPVTLALNLEGGDIILGEEEVRDNDGRHFVRGATVHNTPQMMTRGQWNGTTDANGNFTITFSDPYTVAPTVIFTIESTSTTYQYTAHLISKTTTSATGRVFRNSAPLANSSVLDVEWIAIGQNANLT